MRATPLAIVAALAFAAVAIGGVAVADSAPSAEPHDNGIGTNYTVNLPNEQSNQPGASNADIQHFSAPDGLFQGTSSPEGFERLDTLTIYNQDINFGTCSTEDTRAFGIDRGNDNSGTETDDSLLQHREDSSFNEHSIYVDFYGEDSIAGQPVSLNAEDQVVAVQDGCYGMPDEPGWYQINARINGTGYNGNYIDSDDQGTIRSHYFYICDCSNEQEAREKLGPPPSESGSDGGSDDGGDATPTDDSGDDGGDDGGDATPTDDSGDDGAGDGGGDDGGSDGGDATPTDDSGDDGAGDGGADDGGSDGGDATTTDDSEDGTDTGTATTTDDSEDGTDTGTATTTAGDGGDGDGGGFDDDGASDTPSSGDGPGFGLVAALGGVLAAALLALRRN
jgi:PGF-CTERM protein